MISIQGFCWLLLGWVAQSVTQDASECSTRCEVQWAGQCAVQRERRWESRWEFRWEFRSLGIGGAGPELASDCEADLGEFDGTSAESTSLARTADPGQDLQQDGVETLVEKRQDGLPGEGREFSGGLPAGEASRSDERPEIREIIFAHKMGMALTYDVIQPVNPNGAAVIFVVSGGWNSRYSPPDQFRRMALLDKLHRAGFVVILMRHGSAPLFKVPDAVGDIRRGVRHVRQQAGEYGFAPERLGICGASAGGHLSLMIGVTGDQREGSSNGRGAAEEARVAAVAAYFPPTDLRGMVGPSDQFPALDFDPKLAESVSPMAHISPDDAPTLLVHGTRDRLVPRQHSERLAKALREAGVSTELLILEGAGHGFVGRQAQQAEQAVVDWFERHLLDR
jgi:acetyl esterase/lipase